MTTTVPFQIDGDPSYGDRVSYDYYTKHLTVHTLNLPVNTKQQTIQSWAKWNRVIADLSPSQNEKVIAHIMRAIHRWGLTWRELAPYFNRNA